MHVSVHNILMFDFFFFSNKLIEKKLCHVIAIISKPSVNPIIAQIVNSSKMYLLCKPFRFSPHTLANVALCTSSLQPGSWDSIQQLVMMV